MRKNLFVPAIVFALAVPNIARASTDDRAYVGVHTGWESSSDHYHGYWNVLPPMHWGLGTHSDDGAIVGVHAGFDHSIGKVFVGVEGDFETSGAKVDYTMNGWNMASQTKLQASLRARAGVKFGRASVFATGGLAVAGTDHSYRDTNPASSEQHAHSRTMFGYAAGGGLDYRISERVAVSLEYRHANYGQLATVVNPAWEQVDLHRMYNNSVRIGFSLNL